MSILDDVAKAFIGFRASPYVDVTTQHAVVTKLLQQACVAGQECDPADHAKAEIACNAYGFASRLFLESRLDAFATTLLWQAWNEFSALQLNTRRRVYRAGLSIHLAYRYLDLGDRGSALRWALLTQAYDLIHSHPTDGGAGRDLLRSVLGMTPEALAALKQAAAPGQTAVSQGLFDTPEAFPEDVLARFAAAYPEYAQLFATPSREFEYPINTAYLETLRTGLEAAQSTEEKGRRLENLATYLFLLMPGMVPSRNVLDERRAYETDLVVRNLTPAATVVSELLGRHFIVECKNWATPVRVQEVGYFLYRIRLTHAKFGVMFARSGITGAADDRTAATELIRRAFHEDGTVCIVLDGPTIDKLGKDYLSFWALVMERIERARFGIPSTTAADATTARRPDTHAESDPA